MKSSARKYDPIIKVGDSVSNVVTKIFDSAEESVETVLKTILPFMVFISLIVGFINYTGIGMWLANIIAPIITNLPSMVLVSIICSLPFLSPILGPGAAIAQVSSVLIGTQIGLGVISPTYALPALFVIDFSQVGCDFIPVGLGLAEAKPETVNHGVPAILLGRMISGPAAVILAFAVSKLVGLYS